MPPVDYLNLLLSEVKNRAHTVPNQHLRSIYFGGGTPSLVPAEHIVSVIEALAKSGYGIDESTEITIEINPATINKASLKIYLDAGINRFSVGAQTFNDHLLKVCGREHNAEQTRMTLDLLADHSLNYSFDLLFALPGQTAKDLEKDLKEIEHYQPNHLSTYCLTVPSGHPMDRGRPPEDQQIEMFNLIDESLSHIGLTKYEISNYSKPGKQSLHNLGYWTNQAFWGLGLSAHSYFPEPGCGVRFWNPKSFKDYEKQVHFVSESTPYGNLPENQVEILKLHESLTDICHMYLRLRSGLPEAVLHNQFSPSIYSLVSSRIDKLLEQGLLLRTRGGWALSAKGELLSNLVFQELAFNSEEIH